MTHSTPRQRPRSTTVIGTLAVLLALWLGLAAPAQSAVAPPPGTQAVPAGDGTAPDLDLPFGDGRGGRGRR